MTSPRGLPGDLPPVVGVELLAGGDIAGASLAELADGRQVVVKDTPYPADLEAEGLVELAATGLRVPEVLAVDTHVLVLEHVRADGDLEALGAELASAHRRTHDRFGWHRANVIGPLEQVNTPTVSFTEHFVGDRLLPHAQELPDELADRLRDVCEHVLPALLEHDQPPSLVHGDLWAGNIVDDRAVVDPAVHFGDRELDLAMLDLFGGVPSALGAGYKAVWPLDEGWQRRRPALQLYHLLVHVRLFGAGYHRPVADRLRRLGR